MAGCTGGGEGWKRAPETNDVEPGHWTRHAARRAHLTTAVESVTAAILVGVVATGGYAQRWSAHIVNYADDFVICCKGQVHEAMDAMRGMMEKLKLTVNDDKTSLVSDIARRFRFPWLQL